MYQAYAIYSKQKTTRIVFFSLLIVINRYYQVYVRHYQV